MHLLNSLSKVNNWTEFTVSQREYSKKDQGTRFELLTKELFRLDPLYTSWIRNVWLSSELPIRVQKILNLKSDIGFDLILEDNDGLLIPVQCKYHSDPNRNVGWKEASTFVGLYNDKKICQVAFLCSNAYGVSKNFDSLQGKPIIRVLGGQWSKLEDSFFKSIGNRSSKKLEPYRPLEHQHKAIQDAKSYFLKKGNTRGKLIFPCGSGKSLTGFWFTQHLNAETTLIAVPSLALIKQTLEVYFREITAHDLDVKWLCVCSDSDIGAGVSEIRFSTSEIGIPSTTDSNKIKQWFERTRGDKRFVFTTYQSGQRLAEICKENDIRFDLGIFDEAHKTVGAKDKLFSHLLFHKNIKIDRRIFMTATERFYTGSKDDIASMDNEEIYGEVFSKMSFKDAIATKLLTDYKIITIDVAKDEIASFIRKNKLVELNPKYGKEAEARSLASMFALRKAMQKLPIRNAVSFHSSIDKARRAESIQKLLSEEFGFGQIDTFTVNGKDSVGKRERIIDEFANSNNALITNARCLTEGVDVPKIDCIVFSDPKRSKVDIVQALGRALRKKEGKEWGYVILPVVYDDKTHEIDNESFIDILGIVRGLAANDERIIEFFDDREKNQEHVSSNNDLFNFSTGFLENLDQKFIAELSIKMWQGLSSFKWMNFSEARDYSISLNLKSYTDWIKYFKRFPRPINYPSNPREIYKDEWLGWGDFLGTGNISNRERQFLSFEKARVWARNLNLSSEREWRNYIKNNELPKDIPSNPHSTYGDDWVSWPDFLGNDRLTIQEYYDTLWDYDEASQFLIAKNITSQSQFAKFKKSPDYPKEIPRNPNLVYSKFGTWISWGDFLGTGRKATREQSFIEYNLAKKWARNLNLKSEREWRNYKMNNELPKDIPRSPERVYSDNGWISFADFLGYKKRSLLTMDKGFSYYEDLAREFCIKNNLNSRRLWVEAFHQNQLPDEINIASPDRKFKPYWKSWASWLGSENFSGKRMHELLLNYKDLKKVVMGLDLKTAAAYKRYWKEFRPEGWPSDPYRSYSRRGEWLSWGEFLGTSSFSNSEKSRMFLSYEEAKQLVKQMGITTFSRYKEFARTNGRLPVYPKDSYKNSGWISYDDFFSRN